MNFQLELCETAIFHPLNLKSSFFHLSYKILNEICFFFNKVNEKTKMYYVFTKLNNGLFLKNL